MTLPTRNSRTNPLISHTQSRLPAIDMFQPPSLSLPPTQSPTSLLVYEYKDGLSASDNLQAAREKTQQLRAADATSQPVDATTWAR